MHNKLTYRWENWAYRVRLTSHSHTRTKLNINTTHILHHYSSNAHPHIRYAHKSYIAVMQLWTFHTRLCVTHTRQLTYMFAAAAGVQVCTVQQVGDKSVRIFCSRFTENKHSRLCRRIFFKMKSDRHYFSLCDLFIWGSRTFWTFNMLRIKTLFLNPSSFNIIKTLIDIRIEKLVFVPESTFLFHWKRLWWQTVLSVCCHKW